MSSNCEYYQHLMSQMLDGDLLDAETDALREHTRTCSECRKLCAAFSSMTLCLRESDEQPPESLAQGVMAKIYAAQAAETAQPPESVPVPVPAAENTIESLSPRSKKIVRRWPTYVAAACLVILVGTGLLARTRFSVSTANDTAAAPEMAMAVTADTAVLEEADAETEETAIEGSAADLDTGTARAYSTADQAAAEDTEAATAGTGSAHSIIDPDQVPEGREADFETLLTDAGWPDGEPDVTWHSLYAAEYHGVIYEFLTDDEQQYLVWHDAAEGLYTRSQATVDDLWDIFSN